MGHWDTLNGTLRSGEGKALKLQRVRNHIFIGDPSKINGTLGHFKWDSGVIVLWHLLLSVEEAIEGGSGDSQEFSGLALVAACLLHGQSNILFPKFYFPMFY
jgi:hypothetical protein